MERLTRPNINVDPDTDRFLHATIGGKEIDWKQCRDSTLNVLINGPTSNGFGKDIFRKMARDLYGRLKAYEDTGLTPGQVANAKTIIESAFADDTSKAERIRKLVAADDDGRVVVLPCKVGDTVWRIIRDGEPHITRDEVRDLIIDYLDGAPTINDAEIVVRCKYCKYGSYASNPNGDMVCLRTNDGFWRKEADFCSYGEYQTNTGGVTE